MKSVIGIDASLTGTTIATPAGIEKIVTRKTGPDRLAYIRDRVLDIIDEFAPLVVFLEGYAFARPNQAHQIGELGGVLRVALWQAGHNVVEVAPAARAKWATGKGNASKDAVVSAVSARLGRSFESNDHVDAFVLRDIGMALATQQSELGELTKFRHEVLAKIRVPA